MQIVNFQCGKCGKLMGVSSEHLGTQVHCPHCQEIVETPQPAPKPDSTEVRVEIPDSKEQESIVTHPEDEQGDDRFGGPTRPLVELPPESVAKQPDYPAQSDHALHRTASPFDQAPSASLPETIETPSDQDSPGIGTLPEPTVSRSARSSMLGPTLLVLLIPYSLLTTAYIIWSMFNTHDAFDAMRDTGKDGVPKRVHPDRPLPGKLKTSLRHSIRVGELEIQPLKVEFNREGDLVLLLKMSNMSTDQAFSPIDHSYLFYAETSRKTPRPYSYLDAGTAGKLQGGYLRYLQQPSDKHEDPNNGVIRPGQDVYAEITTLDKYRDTKVKSVLQSGGPLLWRVHVRRGIVVLGGRDVSATAVIGVQFLPSAVEKAKA
ncbi:MAG: hypothetical protein FJ271_08140 [Planctomycetes bacterium]|nr:hypothetical protein [Planctomycetota bacterium]